MPERISKREEKRLEMPFAREAMVFGVIGFWFWRWVGLVRLRLLWVGGLRIV